MRQECLAYAIETKQESGVWGGMTAAERQQTIKGLHLDETHQLAITPKGLKVIRVDRRLSLPWQKEMERLIAALEQKPEKIGSSRESVRGFGQFQASKAVEQ